MNKYQKQFAKKVKLVKLKTGFDWYECKWYAKRRAFYDFIRICL